LKKMNAIIASTIHNYLQLISGVGLYS
jgi:hypothetical protein